MSKPTILINCDVQSRTDRCLLTVNEDYVRAIAESGGLVLIVPALQEEADLREVIGLADGFLFIGGPDYPPDWYGEEPHPETKTVHEYRAAADRALAQAVLASDLPVLGICGGHQLINVSLGGRLIQHPPGVEDHRGGKFHQVTVQGGHILRGLFGEGRIGVNSYHHQAVARGGLAAGLTAVAHADDGTLEAFEGEDQERFLLGIQWHPERCPDEHRRAIFGAFIAAVRQGRAKMRPLVR